MNFTLINDFLTSESLLPLLFSIIAVLSYGFFSRFYEPLTRENEQPLLAATLLYGGAAFFLCIAVLLCILLFGWHFTLSNTVKVFALNFSFTSVGLILLLLIFIMSLLYFAHIGTEAFARRKINMGVYALLFQINVVVIAFMDWIVYHMPLSIYMVSGGILIILSGSLALIARYFFAEASPLSVTLNWTVILLGIGSAIACGLALYIDGEIGRNYILKGNFKFEFLAAFLFYEMLTFGIPCLWAYCTLSFPKAWWYVLQLLIKEFKRSKRDYVLSSLFSAGQFVFSVLALALPGPRFFVAMILALSPLFSILLDKNGRSKRVFRFEFCCGIVSAIGLFLLILVNRQS